MNHRKRIYGGFTLIELLVVIAIIAVLAAILFPVFLLARDAGRRAKCAGNQKQLVSAFILYADDWGGRMPAVWPTDSWTTEWWKRTARPNWAKAVYPYVKTYVAYKCPSSVAHIPGGDRNSPYSSTRAEHPTSYLFNGLAVGLDSRTAKVYGKPLSVCRHLSKTVCVREMKWYVQMAQSFPDYTGMYTMFFGYKAHIDGSNYAFFDGHVKYLKKKQTPTDPNDPFWNFDDGRYVENNPGGVGGPFDPY